MRRVLRLVVGLCFVWNSGCEETPPEPPPDQRIDQAAFALVPIRAAYDKPEGLVTDESARKVENALRLEYAPVECRGKHGRISMNLIQGALRKSPELVRRQGRKIVVSGNGVERVEYKDCRVVGSNLAGPATMLKAFAHAPTTTEEFTYQQALWLGMREPWGLDAGTLSTSFYTFLAENLGAVPPEDRTRASLTVIDLDRSFNPCTADSKKATKDNQVFFKCVAGVSYANTLGFAKYRDKILGFIAKTEGDYLKRLGAVTASDGPEIDGMKIALSATQAPASLPLDGADATIAPPAPPAAADEPESTTPALGILKADKARLVSMLGLRLTNKVSDVYSASNPRVSVTPPPLAADALVGIPADGSWQRISDTFVTQRGDQYLTARAVPSKDGLTYRTASWNVVGDHFWSNDLGISTWQYADSKQAFLRSASNGNPFDPNAGEVDDAKPADSSVKTKALAPGGRVVTTPRLPAGWRRSGSDLVDPRGQVWRWNQLVGSWVKLPPPARRSGGGGGGGISVSLGGGGASVGVGPVKFGVPFSAAGGQSRPARPGAPPAPPAQQTPAQQTPVSGTTPPVGQPSPGATPSQPRPGTPSTTPPRSGAAPPTQPAPGTPTAGGAPSPAEGKDPLASAVNAATLQGDGASQRAVVGTPGQTLAADPQYDSDAGWRERNAGLASAAADDRNARGIGATPDDPRFAPDGIPSSSPNFEQNSGNVDLPPDQPMGPNQPGNTQLPGEFEQNSGNVDLPPDQPMGPNQPGNTQLPGEFEQNSGNVDLPPDQPMGPEGPGNTELPGSAFEQQSSQNTDLPPDEAFSTPPPDFPPPLDPESNFDPMAQFPDNSGAGFSDNGFGNNGGGGGSAFSDSGFGDNGGGGFDLGDFGGI